MKRPAHEVTILALFDRCRSTFGAVRMLAKVSEPDFGQEAAVLTRSLITESLMLMELAAADGTRRIELVAGWELAGLDDMECLLREGQARGQDSGAALEATALRKRQVETYARERGAATGVAFAVPPRGIAAALPMPTTGSATAAGSAHRGEYAER